MRISAGAPDFHRKVQGFGLFRTHYDQVERRCWRNGLNRRIFVYHTLTVLAALVTALVGQRRCHRVGHAPL